MHETLGYTHRPVSSDKLHLLQDALNDSSRHTLGYKFGALGALHDAALASQTLGRTLEEDGMPHLAVNVNRPVATASVCAAESLPTTTVTGEWPLACVRAAMPFTVVFTRELHAANVALVRLFFLCKMSGIALTRFEGRTMDIQFAEGGCHHPQSRAL